MPIRSPVVAGAFYPSNISELNSCIEKFFSKVKVKQKNVIAAVVPHAGYIYCGKSAASVYKTIKNNFDCVVILGPNHSGFGRIATSSGSWATPLGLVETDEQFVKEIIKDSLITNDPLAHAQEHSIEVQLPWLQYRFKNFKFVPICINPNYFDIESCAEIGRKIASTAKKLNKKVLIIASSDFTHYGAGYGYVPFSGSAEQVLKKIKELDMQAADCICKLAPDKLIELCKTRTVCGYGAIAAALYAAKALGAESGEILDYSTSFELSKDQGAIVGYCGIAIF